MQVDKTNGKDMLWELQSIISKMPLSVCCSVVLPEFGVRWKEVSRAVRGWRLPLEPASVARVLCRHLARSAPRKLPSADTLRRLRLHLAARQRRTWHALRVRAAEHEREHEREREHEHERAVARRVRAALARHYPAATAEVECVCVEGVVYVSVQVCSTHTHQHSAPLYLALPLHLLLQRQQHAAVLVSAVPARKLLSACVEGLGYGEWSRAELRGQHVHSLLRVCDPAAGGAAAALRTTAARRQYYHPAPALAHDSLRYHDTDYDRQYVDSILGPDPPLLTSLTITSQSRFFDRALLDKSIKLCVRLQSEDVASTIRQWAVKGAISPDSELVHIFHKIKSNNIVINKEEDDDDNNESE